MKIYEITEQKLDNTIVEFVEQANLNEGLWDSAIKIGAGLLRRAPAAGARVATGAPSMAAGAAQGVKSAGIGVGVGASGLALNKAVGIIGDAAEGIRNAFGSEAVKDVAAAMIKYKIPHALAALALVYGGAKAIGAVRDALGKRQPATESMRAGSVANVAAPMDGVIKRGKNGAPEAPQKKNKNGTVMNALDMPNNIMGHSKTKR